MYLHIDNEPRPETSSAYKPTSLVVAEDHVKREKISAVLNDSGIRVVSVPSKAEALDIARIVQFQLFLLDNSLSNGDAFELSHELRTLAPSTPIVIYSDSDTHDKVPHPKEAPHAVFIAHPLSNTLAKTILQIIS